MRHLPRSLVIGLAALLLAGCIAGSSSPTASAPSSAIASASVPASDAPESEPASAAASVAPSAEPTDNLGPFTCDLPIHIDSTVARANITDVRAATHDGYDRVVFEFAGGIPEGSLERAAPPFVHDPSGMPMDVEGTSFLQLILRGGTKQTDEGTSSYDGPLDFDPGFPMLVDLIEGGDFEGQSIWYLGLNGGACVRVMVVANSLPRIVIDVEH
jgi:hypothetical protein